jgi:hemerythrin-like domain-containing protein
VRQAEAGTRPPEAIGDGERQEARLRTGVDPRSGRRRFLGLALGVAAAGCASSGNGSGSASGEEDVGPAEDLMREHGVLNRVLLVYEECRARIVAKSDLPTGVLLDAANLVQRFVHDYHEVLEEHEVFPRLEEARRHADVTRILREQHAAGRTLTSKILELAAGGFSRPDERAANLATLLTDFVRMYRPHEAREDTVVFPAFHALYTPKEWKALGERFEGRETEVLGNEGFERAVARVAGIERMLGIEDLSKFTPRG